MSKEQDEPALLLARAEAQEQRRIALQGLGRAIISAEVKGTRVVMVGNRVFASSGFRTFHDFLFAYLMDSFGRAWWEAQTKVRDATQHPLIRWHEHVRRLQEHQPPLPAGEVRTATATAAAVLYLQLAYDLFVLDHNAEVREVMLQRLRNPVQFSGARYEAFVGASLARAGFAIEFENECDRSTTHCEFTATHSGTGCKYSVEAKHREPRVHPASSSGRDLIGTRLRKALKKVAAHPRVIFFDVDISSSDSGVPLPNALHRVVSYLRRAETQILRRQPQLAAYIFLTSAIDERDLDSTTFVRVDMQESIGVPELRHGAAFRTVREAVAARDRHRPIYDLLDALQRFADVPSTFDGQLPEFAYGQSGTRLIIGNAYMLPVPDSGTVPGVLLSAFVSAHEGIAVGTYRLADHRTIIAQSPLTPSELRAYHRHPETFFDAPQPVTRMIEPTDAVGMFDFLLATYGQASKEQLLRHLAGSPDIDQLQKLEQTALARIMCERYAETMLRRQRDSARARSD